jgi:hypothetical protein
VSRMSLIGFAVITLFCSQQVLADVDCQAGENLVTGYFGVNPVVRNIPPMLGYPGAEEADLVRVQLAWLAGEEEHRDQELISTDYLNQTQTRVDVYNAETGVLTTDIRDAELLESSNFDLGQLDIRFCMPDNRVAGLVFAIYEDNGMTAGLEVSPFFIEKHPVTPGIPPQPYRTTAVLNQSITDQVSREFNDVAAETIRRDIEKVTGVYPPRYLVESIFQREISATFKESLKDSALFHNPNELTLVAANMLITADHLVLTAPHSVTRVEMNGVNILDENNQIELRNSFLPPLAEIEYGDLSVFVFDEGEKRPALLVNSSPCGGVTIDTISGENVNVSVYCYPSTLHTIVEFWKDDVLEAQFHNVEGDVGIDVPDDYTNYDWTIRDYTCFRDEIIYRHERGVGGIREVPIRDFCQMPGYNDMAMP